MNPATDLQTMMRMLLEGYEVASVTQKKEDKSVQV